MRKLKNKGWCTLLCLLCLQGYAQNTQQVTAIQYYYNTDPGLGVTGNGNVITVTPTANYNQSLQVSIPASLPSGFHTVLVRAKDEYGRWSIAERSSFYVLPQVSTNINAYQFYFDTDPGLGMAGNGNIVSITPTNNYTNASLNVAIPSTIGYGYHTLYFRTRNINGQWSIAERSSFYYMPPLATAINAYQYFYDTDPGVGVAGNGSVVNVSATTAFNQALSLSYPTNLTPGFHTLFFRTRSTNGQWSIAERSSFYVLPQVSSNINAYQYYFDTDPGLGIAGNGNVVSITPTNNYTNASLNVAIPPTIGYGYHTLYFRTRNTNGQWSIAERSSFYYMPPMATAINAYQYFYDNDPGVGVVGNGSVVNVSSTTAFNQALSISYPTNLSPGFHTLFFRTRSTTGVWSIAERSSFYVLPQVSSNINAYQYYFDTDPGLGIAGNGNVVSITPTNNYTNASLNVAIPSNIGYGYHTLYFRTKNTNGQWSIAERSSFYYMPPLATAINAYQYFYDTDPGLGVAGNGAVVNVSSTTAFNQIINVSYPSNLAAGQHTLFFRSRSTDGQWSIAERSNFIVPTLIVAYQYYFDTDPGLGIAGNGAVVTVSGMPLLTQQLNIIIPPALTEGFHNMYVRTLNNLGAWSIVARHNFLVKTPVAPIAINAYQYYFDTEPGVGVAGNGAVVNVGTTASLTQSPNIVLPPTLNGGFHNMYVRTRSTTGEWSIVDRKVFYLDSTIKTQTITQAEYYLSNDPGVGNGTPLAVTASSSLNVVDSIVFPCMTIGNKFMYVRTKDSFGRWSIAERDTVLVLPGMNVPAIAAASDTAFCIGDSVILSTTVADGITCQWHQNGLPIAGATTPVYVAYTSGTYFLQISCAGNGAIGGTNSINVSAQAPTTYYRDYDNDGFGALANSLVSCITPIGYVTDSTDCNDSLASVYPGAIEICFNGIDDNCNGQIDENCCLPPIVSIGNDDEICAPNVAFLNGIISGSYTTSVWSTNGDGYFTNATTLSPTYTPGVNDKTNGTVILTLTANGNPVSCTSSDSKIVKIRTTLPLQPSVVSGAPISVCPPLNGVTLSVTNDANVTTYSWANSPGSNGITFNPVSTTNTQVIDIGATVNSTYNIRVTATNACGSSLYRGVSIRRTTSTPASITGTVIACAGQSYPYSIAAVVGAETHTWTAPAGSSINGGGNTLTTASTSVNVQLPAVFTTGTLSVTANVACFVSPARTITISTSTSALSLITGSAVACPGSSQTYTVPAVTGATSYQWTLPNYTSGSSSTNNINVTFNTGFSSANICVQATSVCGVQTISRCKSVATGLPPTPTAINGIANGICGQTVNYNTPPVSGITGYVWTLPAGATGSSTSNSILVTYAATGITTAPLTVQSQNSCGLSLPRTITIKGAPNSPGTITANPASWCNSASGITFTSNLANVTGSYNLVWSFIPPTAASIQNGQGGNNLLVDWNTGNATVILTASNSCGSGSKTYAAVVAGCRVSQSDVEAKDIETEVSIYPNPATSNLNVSWTSFAKENINLRLMDVSGKERIKNSIASVEGLNNYQFDLKIFAKGVYVLEFTSETKTVKKRIVVQ